jgi:hypothetical protein
MMKFRSKLSRTLHNPADFHHLPLPGKELKFRLQFQQGVFHISLPHVEGVLHPAVNTCKAKWFFCRAACELCSTHMQYKERRTAYYSIMSSAFCSAGGKSAGTWRNNAAGNTLQFSPGTAAILIQLACLYARSIIVLGDLTPANSCNSTPSLGAHIAQGREKARAQTSTRSRLLCSEDIIWCRLWSYIIYMYSWRPCQLYGRNISQQILTSARNAGKLISLLLAKRNEPLSLILRFRLRLMSAQNKTQLVPILGGLFCNARIWLLTSSFFLQILVMINSALDTLSPQIGLMKW